MNCSHVFDQTNTIDPLLLITAVVKLPLRCHPHPGQLSLVIPPWIGEVSTSDGYGYC